jgi:hypothetical protein
MGEGGHYWHRADVAPTKLVRTVRDDLESKVRELRSRGGEFAERFAWLSARQQRLEKETRLRPEPEALEQARNRKQKAGEMAAVLSKMWKTEDEWAIARGQAEAQASIFREYTGKIADRVENLAKRDKAYADAISGVKIPPRTDRKTDETLQERILNLLGRSQADASGARPPLLSPVVDLSNADRAFAKIAQKQSDVRAANDFRKFRRENEALERDFTTNLKLFLEAPA